MPTDKKLAKIAASITRLEHQIILPFTGSPSSGKTSVRRYLEKLGFVTIEEVAGQIIHEQKKGLHDLHPETCMYKFNNENFKRQVKAEKKLQRAQLVLPDRSMYDPIAYFEKLGLKLPEYLEALPDDLYQTVFVFKNLPWVKDGIRHEGAKFAHEIRKYFPKVYAERGANIINVPVFTCKEEDLSEEEREELAKEKQEELYQEKLKQILIDKSIAKRAHFIIGKIKANHPEAELPTGV